MRLLGTVSRRAEDGGGNVGGGGDGGICNDGDLSSIFKPSAQHLHVGGVSTMMPKGVAAQGGGGRGVWIISAGYR